jgi:transcriptional regulator
MSDRDLRKGTADLLILALVEERDRHGYEIARLIEERSGGDISFHVASLYPTLYRLERRGLIVGRWVEREGERRRRFYKLTAKGRGVLADERRSWRTFFSALDRVARIKAV